MLMAVPETVVVAVAAAAVVDQCRDGQRQRRAGSKEEATRPRYG